MTSSGRRYLLYFVLVMLLSLLIDTLFIFATSCVLFPKVESTGVQGVFESLAKMTVRSLHCELSLPRVPILFLHGRR